MLFWILIAIGGAWKAAVHFRQDSQILERSYAWVGALFLWGAMPAEIAYESKADGLTVIVVGVVGGLLLRGLAFKFFGKAFGRSGGKSTERGAVIVGPDDVVKIVNKNKVEWHAVIGNVPVPVDVEPQSFLLSGAPGTGKSQTFLQLMQSARDRGHKAIVADLGGEFTARFFRPGVDVLLNPFDERNPAAGWSPFAEVRSAFDCARAAASLIQIGEGESANWDENARTLVQVLMERCLEAGPAYCTNSMLLYMALAAPLEEVRAFVVDSAAAPWFEEGNERFLGSVKGSLVRQLQPLQWLKPEAGQGAFSIKKWSGERDDSWLFITYRDDQLQALRAVIAAQIDVCASSILSRDSREPAPLWFFMDEFATLGKIGAVVQLAAKGRKYNSRLVLGLQTISQARAEFGKDAAQSLLACLGTWLVLKQPDAETAEYMSQFIGDEEARRVVASGGEGSQSNAGQFLNNSSTHENWQEQVVRQRAIMPAELQKLENRVGILNIAGDIPCSWTVIPISQLPRVEEPFQDAQSTRGARIARPSVLGAAPAAEQAAASPKKAAADPFAAL